MKFVFLITIALIAFTMVYSITAEPMWNIDNIQDVLLALGSDGQNMNKKVLVEELNQREENSKIDQLLTTIGLTADVPSGDNVNQLDLRDSAYYSAIARCLTFGTDWIKNWSCKQCQKVPKLIDVYTGVGKPSDIPWFVGYSPEKNQIVTAGRSSTSIENWLYDLDFRGVDYSGCSGCQVHQGFMNSYKELRKDWLNAIDALVLKYPTAGIRVEGHSLAAAVATHAVLDLVSGSFTKLDVNGVIYWHNNQHSGYNDLSDEEFYELTQIPGASLLTRNKKYNVILPFYNFGSPRVGNEAWSNYFKKVVGFDSLIRSTHLNDPVPRLPPQNLIWKYQHPSNEIYWYSDSKYKNCNDHNGEDKTCALGNLFPINPLDHMWYNGILLACALI